MTTDLEVETKGSPMISRRTLVRSGAAVAWTVPIVQIVAAGPASASVVASQPTLGFLTNTATWGNNGQGAPIDVAFTIKNTGNAATSNVTITLTFPFVVTLATPPTSTAWLKASNQATSSATWVFVAQSQFAVNGTTPAFSARFDTSTRASSNPGAQVSFSGTYTPHTNPNPGTLSASATIGT